MKGPHSAALDRQAGGEEGNLGMAVVVAAAGNAHGPCDGHVAMGIELMAELDE